MGRATLGGGGLKELYIIDVSKTIEIMIIFFSFLVDLVIKPK